MASPQIIRRRISLVVVLFVLSWMWTASAASQPAEPVQSGADFSTDSLQSQEAALFTGPPLFSYQGELLNAGGSPVTNPSVAMTFRLYTTPSGGTACWSENQTVDVRNGVFSVLLGQMTAINSACLAGDAYLELAIGGEILSPRERLTSVAHAVEASTLSAGAVTRGGIALGGPIDMRHDAIVNVRALSAPTDAHLDIMYGQSQDMFIKSNGSGNVYVGMGGNVNLGVSGVVRTGNLHGSGNQQIHMPGGDDMYINWHSGRSVHFGGGNELPDVSITPSGMDLHGNSITNCGALVEANLQTPEEIQAGRIERFELGDLLCWSAKDEQLDLCSTANDPLIMAVGDSEGRPIVLGAELVKVLGPVQAGDYLVASHVPGYAMATRTPSFGIVIAQALEGFDGEQGLIKAMIRKM